MRYQVICGGALGAGTWAIADDNGAPRFEIRDHEWASQRSFQLAETATGRTTLGHLRSTWRHEVCDLYRSEELAASISTSLLRDIRAQFVGEVPGPDTLVVRGDFVAQNYRFCRCSRTVAVVSTVWEESRRAFGVEIRCNEDHSMILAAVLGIRCLCGEPEDVRVFGVPKMGRLLLGPRQYAGA